jgi:predicted RNase H-like HicB family nuclease
MSATLKKSSAKTRKPIDRPFAPEVLRDARAAAPKYQLVLHEEQGEGYSATVLELPNVFGFGETVEKCVAETRELLVTMIAFMTERGESIPSPAVENKRSEQVNVRLTAMEKLRLEHEASSGGYRGISDFIRERALRQREEPPRSIKRKPKRAS